MTHFLTIILIRSCIIITTNIAIYFQVVDWQKKKKKKKILLHQKCEEVVFFRTVCAFIRLCVLWGSCAVLLCVRVKPKTHFFSFKGLKKIYKNIYWDHSG